jgi:hypothetical protein
MNYDPMLDQFDDDQDDDDGDGLSPWARASQKRWLNTAWLETLDAKHGPATGRRNQRRWEARKLQVLGLTDVRGDPAETCTQCNPETEPPPSGVRTRSAAPVTEPKARTKPAPVIELKTRKKPRKPTLKLV